MKVWEIILAAAFLVSSGIHCILGFQHRDLPGWKMFRRIDRYEYRLRTSDGRQLDIRDFVLERAYVMAPDAVTEIAKWYAEKHPDQTPLRLELKLWRKTGRVLEEEYDVHLLDSGRAIALNREMFLPPSQQGL